MTRQPHPNRKQQQGVVIVMALFIVALVAVMSYVMMARLERDTRRTSLILRNNQAEYYAQGSVFWAQDLLKNNWNKKTADKVIDEMPATLNKQVENGFEISSHLEDMQGRFNLNQLTDVNKQLDFVRLMLAVEPSLGNSKALELTRAITDWVSAYSKQNNLDSYYQELPVPYRDAHRPMINVSELRLVKGITPEIYAALLPHVAALPGMEAVNVQTASVPVLMSLGQGMTPTNAEQIVRYRKNRQFVSTQAFSALEAVKSSHLTASNITVSSRYFLLRTDIEIENQHLVLYTLLDRTLRDNKPVVSVIWQSIGES